MLTSKAFIFILLTEVLIFVRKENGRFIWDELLADQEVRQQSMIKLKVNEQKSVSVQKRRGLFR